MIVVAGGTGTLGTRLVPCLAGAGLAVRVLTRDPARAQHPERPAEESLTPRSNKSPAKGAT